MSNAVAEPIPKRLFSPVAPSFLHECQFNILLIQAEKQKQQQQQQKQQPTFPIRRLNTSEKNTKLRSFSKTASNH
jgi:hypothetical protein